MNALQNGMNQLSYLNTSCQFRDEGSKGIIRYGGIWVWEACEVNKQLSGGDKEFGREPLHSCCMRKSSVRATCIHRSIIHLLLLLHCQRTIIMRSLQHLQVIPSKKKVICFLIGSLAPCRDSLKYTLSPSLNRTSDIPFKVTMMWWCSIIWGIMGKVKSII